MHLYWQFIKENTPDGHGASRDMSVGPFLEALECTRTVYWSWDGCYG